MQGQLRFGESTDLKNNCATSVKKASQMCVSRQIDQNTSLCGGCGARSTCTQLGFFCIRPSSTRPHSAIFKAEQRGLPRLILHSLRQATQRQCARITWCLNAGLWSGTFSPSWAFFTKMGVRRHFYDATVTLVCHSSERDAVIELHSCAE